MMQVPEFIPMSARQRELLLKRWAKTASEFMSRDGRNAAFADGGHHIKGNPLLIAAIEEVRDGYYQLFDERRHLLSHPELPQCNTHIFDNDYDLMVHNNASISRLKQPDFGFTAERKAEILHAASMPQPLSLSNAFTALGKLIEKSIKSVTSGLKPERGAFPLPVAPIIDNTAPQQLSLGHAYDIFGKTVLNSIKSFYGAFKSEGVARIVVPELGDPEELGYHRSRPRTTSGSER